jgi:hypothetical protein
MLRNEHHWQQQLKFAEKYEKEAKSVKKIYKGKMPKFYLQTKKGKRQVEELDAWDKRTQRAGCRTFLRHTKKSKMLLGSGSESYLKQYGLVEEDIRNVVGRRQDGMEWKPKGRFLSKIL